MSIQNQEKYFTPLDTDLRNLAMTDWATFVELVGYDNILAAKICLMRRNNSSYGKIQMKLGVSFKKARYNSSTENCKCSK